MSIRRHGLTYQHLSESQASKAEIGGCGQSRLNCVFFPLVVHVQSLSVMGTADNKRDSFCLEFSSRFRFYPPTIHTHLLLLQWHYAIHV